MGRGMRMEDLWKFKVKDCQTFCPCLESLVVV